MVTLFITLVDKDRIVQASDRRLTKITGELHDDNANKAVCVGMNHIHFSTAYTGLAYIGRPRLEDRTDYWLLEHLGSITRDGETSIESICDSLGQRATSAISRLPGKLQHKGLKIVLAGFDRANRPFRATVSNIKFSSHDICDVRDRFKTEVKRYEPWNPTPDIDIAGAIGTFEGKDPTAKALKRNRKKVIKHLKDHGKTLAEERVAQVLVDLIRSATRHPKYGSSIGRDCLSVVTFRKESSRKALFTQTVVSPAEPAKDALFTGFYHPVATSTVRYIPHLADPYIDYMDVVIDLDPECPDK